MHFPLVAMARSARGAQQEPPTQLGTATTSPAHPLVVPPCRAAGVPEDERYEGDDLEVLARAEEAEEAAFGDEEVRANAWGSVFGGVLMHEHAQQHGGRAHWRLCAPALQQAQAGACRQMPWGWLQACIG